MSKKEVKAKEAKRKIDIKKIDKKVWIIIGAVAAGLLVGIPLIINAIPKGQTEDEPTNVVSGETSTDDKKEKELTIKDSGWTYYTVAGWGGYISYGVEVYNSSEYYLASFPKVKCTGRDEDGKILFSYDELVDYVYPKETIFVGTTFNVDEKPATIEITVEVSKNNWESTKGATYPKNNTQIVSNVSEQKDDNLVIYNGEIENTSDTDLSNDILTVIFKKDGKIVGGNNTYSDNLDAGQKSIFTIYASTPPVYDTYEVSARIGSIN